MRNLKNNPKANKGITLIALVITIVILIILAAVVINTIVGENGILSRVKYAKKRYNEAEAYETMNLKLAEARIGAEDSTIEGNFLYKIAKALETINGIESVESTSRTASIDSSLSNSIERIFVVLRDYDFEFVIVENGKIESFYKLGEGNSVIKDVDAPTVTIIMSNSEDYLFTITSSITIHDDSGIDFNNCKYIYTNSSEPIGDDITLYTEGNLNEESKTINTLKGSGTYYLHVYAKDVEGNASETISSNSVTISSVVNYDYATDTTTGDGIAQTASLLPGNYKFECWGAQGGQRHTGFSLGGYTAGNISIANTTTFYIYVGQQGTNDGNTTFNGGGKGRTRRLWRTRTNASRS